MAEKFGRNRSTGELIAEIGRSRERVARDLRGLHYELDFPESSGDRFENKQFPGLQPQPAVGTLIVLLPLRRKKIYVDAKKGRQTPEEISRSWIYPGGIEIAASVLRP